MVPMISFRHGLPAARNLGATPATRFGADKDETAIDYQKIDGKLAEDIKEGKVPISLFIQTRGGGLNVAQVKELADLGLTAYPIVGNIATGRLNDLSNLAKITQLKYIHLLSGSHQLKPHFN